MKNTAPETEIQLQNAPFPLTKTKTSMQSNRVVSRFKLKVHKPKNKINMVHNKLNF